VGEQQIYSQLRAAYASAAPAGTVGHTLDEVVEQSLRASNRIRNQTTLDTADASIISEAFAEAATALAGADPPTLVGRRALLIGVGSLGHLTTAWLRPTGWSKSWCATVPTPAPSGWWH
jgi:glutamyl-tRNA reductase